MKIKNILLLFLLIISFNLQALPKAKITLKVVDELGVPIEGAKAITGFTMPVKTGWGSRAAGSNGLTDSDGLFSAEGETEPYVGLGAMKEGYYRTQDTYDGFKEVAGFIGLRKWQPWNPTIELVLKEIKKPISLYAYKIRGIELPVLNKFIGFDLVARDWVVPYGSGTRKDFLFKLEVHQEKSMFEYDATLTLKFSNPSDGLYAFFDDPKTGSVLRSSHNAPIADYNPEFVLRRKRDTRKLYTPKQREDQNYFFRIRTETDEKGDVVSALYGKIYGSIGFGGIGYKDVSTAQIGFNYYLNPKLNDTNLEFDTKKNLFKDLNSMEKVRNP